MKKSNRVILQKIDFAIDDYLYGNCTFDEIIERIFTVCYCYFKKKELK